MFSSDMTAAAFLEGATLFRGSIFTTPVRVSFGSSGRPVTGSAGGGGAAGAGSTCGCWIS